MASSPRYPDPSNAFNEQQKLYLQELNLILTNRDKPRIVNKTPYLPTNATLNRTFDASSVTTAQLADIVYTLLKDLQAAGIIGVKE